MPSIVEFSTCNNNNKMVSEFLESHFSFCLTEFYLECFSVLLDCCWNEWSLLIMATLIWPEAGGVFQRETLESLVTVVLSHIFHGCRSPLPSLYRTLCHINLIRPNHILSKLAGRGSRRRRTWMGKR